MSSPDHADNTLFRLLPSVDELLRQPAIAALVACDGPTEVVSAARATLDELRAEIAAGRLDEPKLELALTGIADAIARRLRARLSYSLRTVINATGVVLHTNLGRAPLSASALAHVTEVARGYSNLEFDVPAGERGKRDVHVDRLFRRLFSEVQSDIASVVVNNNAAAVMLALNTLAEGGEVVVSRGELVEIGGSFRIPDVMAKSGAVLREVGTTNRTRLSDYERAINEHTKLLLRVHRSNFQIVGFTEQPSLGDLAELAHKHHLPLLEDLGSGALLELRTLGIQGEPSVADSLRSGVDVVTYSGDKLLGGPQAGIISGRKELVGRIRINPIFRALRVDKLTYAALEATLRDYARQDYDAIPTLRMLRLPAEEVRKRADALRVAVVAGNRALKVEIVPSQSVIGGGAAPAATLPSFALAMTHASLSADDFAARLRAGEPPIVARVEEGRVLLDLRTVFPEQDAALQAALLALR